MSLSTVGDNHFGGDDFDGKNYYLFRAEEFKR